MKKIILTLLFVTCLALVMTGSAQAVTSFTGSTYMSYGDVNSVIITTSHNVYVVYNGDSTNGQSYGAFSKNQAGDKYYATGGGVGAANGIYFEQNDTWVGNIAFSGMTSTLFTVSAGDGWTAQ